MARLFEKDHGSVPGPCPTQVFHQLSASLFGAVLPWRYISCKVPAESMIAVTPLLTLCVPESPGRTFGYLLDGLCLTSSREGVSS